MGDYVANIDTYYYRYVRPIYITDTTGQDRTFLPIKLSLNSTNFNFGLMEFEDGRDFRVSLNSNGSGALQTWIAYWSNTYRSATVFIKLPNLLANSKVTLWVFWGNPAAWSISNIKYMTGEEVDGETSTPVFIFGDAFNNGITTLDTNKWDSSGTIYTYGTHLSFDPGAYIQAKNNPLSGYRYWQYEDGFLKPDNGSNQTYYAHRVSILGGENNSQIQYFNEGSVNRKHDFVVDGTFTTYNAAGTGLEQDSYHNTFMRYYETTDRVYQGIQNRTTGADYEESWERQVLRNTWQTYPRIYGPENSAAGYAALYWAILWEYDPDTYPTIDLSGLYVPYANVEHQSEDTTVYQSDITSIEYYHETDAGGDPYALSDNLIDSPSNIWISEQPSGYAIIDFARSPNNLVNQNYIHLDNDHVAFYGAAKLSDYDTDIHSRNYWQATTTSGVWASILFPETKAISTVVVRAVPSKLSGMIKNYKIYGANRDPRQSASERILLAEGTFQQTSGRQVVYLRAKGKKYYFYILQAESTYGGNVALQEWEMYGQASDFSKKVVSQLRLRPVSFDDNESYFPKQITISGTNDYNNWTEIANFETYTPFRDYYTYGRWQRYSFTNDEAYYAYAVYFDDNWGADGAIFKVAEWEMVEKEIEASTYRVLGGATNNFTQVWADNVTTFDSGHIYAVNEAINTIFNDSLYNSTTVSGSIDDINVMI